MSRVCAGRVSILLKFPYCTTAINDSPRGKLVDLGSGDGRVIIEAAKQGIPSMGIELNGWLVLYSKWRAFREGTTLARYAPRRACCKFEMASVLTCLHPAGSSGRISGKQTLRIMTLLSFLGCKVCMPCVGVSWLGLLELSHGTGNESIQDSQQISTPHSQR